uniref:Amino acid transporter transmembrane domain-containing protein n=1 Tax=Aegilops tauschii subsp. strangulata TaxID=200361 RepID=A0A453M8U6_AEGTS
AESSREHHVQSRLGVALILIDLKLQLGDWLAVSLSDHPSMAPEVKVPLLEGRGATPAQTLGNIVVSIVGTGVLGLPYAFRTAGWLAGTLGVAGAGAATFYCMLLLGQAAGARNRGGRARR